MPGVMLFESRTEAAVLDSVRRLREEAQRAREAELAEYENLYLGDRARCAQYLIRHHRERDNKWNERLLRFTNQNYYARFCDAIVDGVYGDPVERGLEESNKAQDAILADVFDRNAIDSLQRLYGLGQVRDGEGWINVAWRDNRESVALFNVHAANVWYQCDPNDPTVITDLVERRIQGRALGTARNAVEQKYTYWVVNSEWLWELDDEGHTITPKFPNPYGRIPYVRILGRRVPGYDDGVSVVRDLVSMQKRAINRGSDLDTLIRYQAHALLVTISHDQPEVETGPVSFLNMPVGGDAKYIQPNAPIADVLSVHEHELSEMAEIANVPLAILRGDESSSGIHLAMKTRPFMRLIHSLRTEARVGERDLIRCVCAVGRAHGLALPEDPMPRVKFSDNVIPIDKDGEFTRDYQQVTANPPLMTRREFITRWNPDIAADAKAIEAYLAELDQEANAKAEREALVFGGGNPGGSGFFSGLNTRADDGQA